MSDKNQTNKQTNNKTKVMVSSLGAYGERMGREGGIGGCKCKVGGSRRMFGMEHVCTVTSKYIFN